MLRGGELMQGDAVSNADLAILLLIADQPNVNGYGLRRLVEERSYGRWAGVSATSIYNRLKQLERRGHIAGTADVDKVDRGPRGRIYTITAAGIAVLTAEIKEGLTTTREHDPRFNLALCGLELLSSQTAARCLSDRARFLDDEAARLVATLAKSCDEMSLSAILLYERIVHAIAAERDWLAGAIAAVQNSERRDAGELDAQVSESVGLASDEVESCWEKDIGRPRGPDAGGDHGQVVTKNGRSRKC